jgi:hypothetical protein
MAIAGHVSQRMLFHNSSFRLEATRKALAPVSGGAFEGRYDSFREAKFLRPTTSDRNDGGVDETRIRDLWVRGGRSS